MKPAPLSDSKNDVTIIGAGPYGLSVAAHLRALGVPFRIFGQPMEFWRNSMPAGMRLKSEGFASSLSDPDGSFTLAQYCLEHDVPYADLGLPVKLATFVDYGMAFQARFAPDLEQSLITSVEPAPGGFTVDLSTGESYVTSRIVVAVGIGRFAHIPRVLSELSSELSVHSSEFVDPSAYRGLDVAVIGAGSSALDSAALLSQSGARPVIVARGSDVQVHERTHYPRRFRNSLRAPTSAVGPGWRLYFFCNAPGVFHYLPERWRLEQTKTQLGPAGGWFLRDAILGKVPILVNSGVEGAAVDGGRISLRLKDDGTREQNLVVDRVVCATGFQVDVDRIDFLAESLRARVATVKHTPILNSQFESSVPGLHFIGVVASNSFGPLQRFACGASFAAQRVTRAVSGARSQSGGAAGHQGALRSPDPMEQVPS